MRPAGAVMHAWPHAVSYMRCNWIMHLILHCGLGVITLHVQRLHHNKNRKAPQGKQKVVNPNYSIMYYKNNNLIGVRRKFGGKEQAFSFGGKRCELSEEQLREYADQALEKLGAGLSEADVSEMMKSAIAPPEF